jgi:hypothetical protein
MNNSLGETQGVLSAEQPIEGTMKNVAFDKVRLAGQPAKKRTFNGSRKLRDEQRGSRRLRSA